MRIADVFVMGYGYGDFGYGHSHGRAGRTACESRVGHFKGCIPNDDPRNTRTGLAHILGSPSDGSGILGILSPRP